MTAVLRAALACGLLLVAARVGLAQEELSGRVIAADSGEPVARAEVAAGEHSVTTGEDGWWRLIVPEAGERVVVVRHIGFAERTVRLATGSPPVTIELTPRPVELGDLVVTAARRVQRLRDVPVTTEVIGSAELRQSGAPDLAAVLVEQTGMVIEGGHPIGTGVMLQGLGSERVLVLIDGQPYIGRLSGRLDLSRIPVWMVDRVEVVKGPQSTLYGSEAMGGVVNVITRAPDSDVWRGILSVTHGSHGRLDLGGNVMGNAGALAFTADAGRRTMRLVSGHVDDTGTLATRRDASTRVDWRLAPYLSLSGAGTLLTESQRWKSGPFYSFADNTHWSARLGGEWRPAPHSVTPTLYATEFRHLSRRATGPQPVEGTGEEEVQRLVEVELLYALDAGSASIDAGLELRRESIRSDRVQGGNRVHRGAEPFVQVTWAGSRWSLVPGVRLAWSDQWGTYWTPRLAAMYRPTERLALRASVGRGYRAPDFKELFMEFLNIGPGFAYTVRGNPDLRPESSRNITASVEWAGDRLYLRGQAFHNRFVDFIETELKGDSSGVDVHSYSNIDDGVTRGVEAEIGAAWRRFRFEGSYAWLQAERANSGEVLLGRPAHTGRVSAHYSTPFGLRAGLTASYTGETPTQRTESGDVVTRAGFTRVAFNLAAALPAGFELTAGVDNVTDVHPADWPGFMGRQFHIGLSWRAERNTAPSSGAPIPTSE
ncbi:MAG TPA: TonB-dependent receptor [Longimicrobiales bacterium]|nr:TonB-dependent receptor [Longimicrobiales bacterium]